MGSLGPFELILIFLVVLLIFGAKKIPEIARGIGKGINEFKAATREISSEIDFDDSRQRSSRRNQSIQAPRSPEQGQTAARSQEPVEEPAPEPQKAGNPSGSHEQNA